VNIAIQELRIQMVQCFHILVKNIDKFLTMMTAKDITRFHLIKENLSLNPKVKMLL